VAKKLRVGVLFGGRSGEHEISLRSAQSVVAALDRDKFDVTLIGIDLQGGWHALDTVDLQRLAGPESRGVDAATHEIALLPRPSGGELREARAGGSSVTNLDVVFPVLHGTFGEDGTVQGLLELADVAYVGAGVLGSAVGMDKGVQKRLLQAAGIPVVPYFALTRHEWLTHRAALAGRATALGYPVFVKPANLGSSVGISKVRAEGELEPAIATALEFDTKVLVEKGLDVREIEVAVLGNEEAQASLPGEICPSADFYSYAAKYIDEKGAALKIPAPLDPEPTAYVRGLALEVFRILECAGMARVDFFLERGSNAWYVNEINTIPGFTSISMYPKLWEATGIPYGELLSRLIELAIERQQERRALKRSFEA